MFRVFYLINTCFCLDDSLPDRTNLSVDDIIGLLEFVLSTTYFSFREKLYQQTCGVAMGSPCSPLVANLFLDRLENSILDQLQHKPKFYGRYVDDIFSIVKKDELNLLHNKLNSFHPNVQFTVEQEENGCLPFLNVLVKRNEDGTLETEVFRKSTHTEMYLQYESHHPMSNKIGVVKTLLHNADILCSNDESKSKEINCVNQALRICGYPDECLHKASLPNPPKEVEREPPVGFTCIPYIKGLSEAVRSKLTKYGIQVAFKPNKTLRNILVHPKDPIPKDSQTGAIYKISCNECSSSYVGETGRQLSVRVSEHRKALTSGNLDKSAVALHSAENLHSINWSEVKILDKIQDFKCRKIREAIEIVKKVT